MISVRFDCNTTIYIIWVMKLKRLRWAGHVARTGKRRGVYRFLVGKPEGKRPLGRPRSRWKDNINPLTPNDPYSGRTAPLTSKRCILYIYSTNIGTEYFKYGIYSPFFSLQNAVCIIILTYLVPVLFTFLYRGCAKVNPLTPNGPYSWRTAPLTSKVAFYIFIQQI